ncbi:claudin-34-like [Gadus chalcogrammus]|uniref:claudin-34-like n=1 Tax=Gadus chalcogrammus TaxID=1042646 RepID=UPI0024C3A2CF|nr:claudin-34-like [Gadus chalcogrammus]XP_056450011.1 claudin-34-like [Gadus chalcogrammus]
MQPPVHAQLAALCLSLVSWTLGVASLGVVEWRAWHVEDRSVVTSGVAAVGVWRTCFHSHVLVSPGLRVMFCRGMGVAEDFLPDEITAVQVVVPLGLAVGLGGNAAAVAALRGVYVGRGWGGARAFLWAGWLCALSALLSLGPLAWNLHSMLGNQTIAFPLEFHLPTKPVRQSPGVGVIVATAAAVLMLISGIMFLCYRPPPAPAGPTAGPRGGALLEAGLDTLRLRGFSAATGKDNAGFEPHTRL